MSVQISEEVGDFTTRDPTHCHLCGRPLSNPTSKDHCPPRALFSRELRREHNLSRLLTIPVHKECNASYQLDEDYFIATITPLAPGSVAGDSIFKERMKGARNDRRKRALATRILDEFEPRPSGLYLPRNSVMKRQDGERISRVAWKIVRGLYFLHRSVYLPVTLSVGCTLTPPGQRPPEIFLYMSSLPEDEMHGRYPGVFDYRFGVFDTDMGKLNYWALLIWDRIIITVYFHEPWDCQCPDCTAAVATLDARAASDRFDKPIT